MNNFAPLISAYKDLNNVFKSKLTSFSQVQATVKPLSSFARISGQKKPLMIHGRLVTANTYPEKGYTAPVILRPEVLKKTLSQWVNLPIYTSHDVLPKVLKGEPISVREVVGRIVKTEWNEKDKAIDYYAEISDDDIAGKMEASLIKHISVDFFRDVITDFDENKKLQNYYIGVEPKSAALLLGNPRDKTATFEPVFE